MGRTVAKTINDGGRLGGRKRIFLGLIAGLSYTSIGGGGASRRKLPRPGNPKRNTANASDHREGLVPFGRSPRPWAGSQGLKGPGGTGSRSLSWRTSAAEGCHVNLPSQSLCPPLEWKETARRLRRAQATRKKVNNPRTGLLRRAAGVHWAGVTSFPPPPLAPWPKRTPMPQSCSPSA